MKPSSQPQPAPADACPCGSGLPYPACCGRWHQAHAQGHGLTAPDALALMRSRYSAFVQRNWAYLLATWHPGTRPASLKDEAGTPLRAWLGLQIKGWGVDGDAAWVEFVARSKLAGRAHRLHERSRFVRQGGAWLYLDGDTPSPPAGRG
jgi:SEC-C motif-containing protein